jgi:hypothetical protein
MPIGRTRRHVQANQIVVLVARAAFNGIQAVPVCSTVNLHRVSMAIISLARKISLRVAIHTARMVKDCHNRFERSSGPGIVARHDIMSASCFRMFRGLNRNPQEQKTIRCRDSEK